MNATSCEVQSCDRPRRGGRPYCNAHLRRLERTGDLMVGKPIRYAPTADERDDIAARIMRQSRRTDRGCIEWTGLRAGNGYGHITWKGRQMGTHRAIWTALVGDIPKGKAPDGSAWTIDHLCSNRLCVNVGHLEVVSRTENSNRGGGLAKAHRANRKAAAEKAPPPHGALARYDRHGCRCVECKAANAAASANYRARKRQESQ